MQVLSLGHRYNLSRKIPPKFDFNTIYDRNLFNYDKKYKNIAEDIFNGICNKYLKIYNGNIELGGICLVAGLGNALWRDGSFDHYIKEEVVTNDAKGVGPFIMAYIEGLIA